MERPSSLSGTRQPSKRSDAFSGDPLSPLPLRTSQIVPLSIQTLTPPPDGRLFCACRFGTTYSDIAQALSAQSATPGYGGKPVSAKPDFSSVRAACASSASRCTRTRLAPFDSAHAESARIVSAP